MKMRKNSIQDESNFNFQPKFPRKRTFSSDEEPIKNRTRIASSPAIFFAMRSHGNNETTNGSKPKSDTPTTKQKRTKISDDPRMRPFFVKQTNENVQKRKKKPHQSVSSLVYKKTSYNVVRYFNIVPTFKDASRHKSAMLK